MLLFKSNVPHCDSELQDVVKMFCRVDTMQSKIKDVVGDSNYNNSQYQQLDFSVSVVDNKNVFNIIIGSKNYTFIESIVLSTIKHENRKLFVRQCKIALYKALSSHFNKQLPWGSLTGIRPSKMVYEMLNSGLSLSQAKQKLQDDYFVSSKKADLIISIVENQINADSPQVFAFKHKKNNVNLYVHVPFCPSRCNYCSFVSVPLAKQRHLLDPYVDTLVDEIKEAKDILTQNNKQIYSIYIGGGTPTVLNDQQLEKILKEIGADGSIEFTLEAGRPETLTKNNLSLMKNYGVTRISVNPQSLNNKTLEYIGRGHTAEEFYNGYNLAKQFGFSINVDLIAGLQGESLNDFLYTLKEVVLLDPCNITVHTLSVKRGSALNQGIKNIKPCLENSSQQHVAISAHDSSNENSVAAMLDSVHQILLAAGYSPYYLYRQKNMQDNLENVGYAKANKVCVNNITVMEEQLSVVACGAGAISKAIDLHTGLIERFASPKDVKMYLERYKDIVLDKKEFFDKRIFAKSCSASAGQVQDLKKLLNNLSSK